jgi:hypothetical protein
VSEALDATDVPVRPLRTALRRLRRRAWPLLVMVVFAVVGMAYSLWWSPVVHHTHAWVIPGDIWSTWRAAHWVGWGALGHVYGPDTQLVTFPGVAVILAPLAMISSHLGLSESIDPIFLSTPTSWFLLGPASMLLGSSCLFSLDAVAEELGTSSRRRIVLSWMEAVIMFQVLVIWGHPEDLISLGLALYGFLAVARGRWTLSGCLWGVAIVVQPLVLLLFPLQFVQLPKTARLRFCGLAVLPSFVFVGTPLISNWGQTTKVLFHQANFPTVDHATPWIAFSPHLSSISVAAGPGRMVALIAAVGLGVAAWRYRPSIVGLVWLGAVALTGRCFFESVMVPFYLGPPCALIVLASSVRKGSARMVVAWLAAMVATILSFRHWSEWGYWLPMVAMLTIGLACAYPGRAALGIRARHEGRGSPAPVPDQKSATPQPVG